MKSTLSPTLEASLAALQQANYQEAIERLEAFCHNCALNAQLDRDYFRAQMHLIQVYEQTGQTQQAVKLCRYLSHCTHAQVQIWARQRLSILAPQRGIFAGGFSQIILDKLQMFRRFLRCAR